MTIKSENVKKLTIEQERVVENKSKRLVVSASAGSGKTFVVVEKLIDLICNKKVPVSKLLVLTFTKAAASELKSRLYTEILNQPSSPFLLEQLDDILVSDISTIDSFCEKVIKRNINKLSLAQNFIILDEKNSKKLKNNAFRRTFEYFSNKKSDQFEEIYFAFKRNDEAIEECMFSLQSFFDSLSNSQEKIESFLNDAEYYHQKACEYLLEYIKNKFSISKDLILQALKDSETCEEKLAKGHIEFADELLKLVSVDFEKDLFTICKEISFKKVPSLSRAKCPVEIKEKFSQAKECVQAGFSIAESLKIATENMIVDAKNGKLSKTLMEFYIYFAREYKSLKEKRFALDFADLEKNAQILLKDEEIKKSLQQRYDYIFIDEYQDTNRLQESILKPIAEGGFFIAVGDIKQGIYGFRNASKEIMSSDIDEFSSAEDGEALFLRGNFRTDKRILNFVNTIFEKIMTTSSVGIDYKGTSMLEGLNTFIPNDLPAVTIDIVEPQKQEKIEEDDEWKEIYSVKNASMVNSYKFKDEIETIAARIDEVLSKKIYSPKLKAFRDVEQGDIALLFRSRSSLMQECAQYLQEKGFAVNADIKENLLDDSEISLIISLLKLTLNPNDDIPLASVMVSPFGGFTFDELSSIRLKYPDGKFYEIVNQENNEKIVIFFEKIEKFKFNMHVKGIVKALEELFNSTNYYDYINSLNDKNIKINNINKFFTALRSNDLDFCPQEVVSQFENSKKEDKKGSDGGNAITLTTIHATKGLEYPIVMLCGGGDSLASIYNKNFISTSEFGLATYLYSIDDNLRIPSPAFLAGKMAKKEREMIDELMLFYVAVTRAQNHLYIIGRGKLEDYTFDNLSKQNSYLKLIFFALGENLTNQLFSQESISTENYCINVVSGVIEEKSKENEKRIISDNQLSKFSKEIEVYQNFVYPNNENCKFSYKNSVTGATKMLEDDYLKGEVLYSENKETAEDKFSFEKAIEIGNSYHEALKYIDFEKVHDESSLKDQLESVKKFLSEGYYENIDQNLLLKNILLLKDLLKNKSLYKEREFIMECSISELKSLTENADYNKKEFYGDSVIVQGIIDLFAVGEEIILVDYKYTSTRNEDILKERYKGQIKLYENALEKAFGKKISAKYLLSLKSGKLIKFE